MMAAQNLRPTRGQLEDLALRALWTAVEAFTAVLLGAGAGFWDVEVYQAAGIAAFGAVISAVKSFAAQRLQRSPEPMRTVEHETPPVW